MLRLPLYRLLIASCFVFAFPAQASNYAYTPGQDGLAR